MNGRRVPSAVRSGAGNHLGVDKSRFFPYGFALPPKRVESLDSSSSDGLFMGIEYQLHRLSVVVLDARLGMAAIYVDHVRFDCDLPEFSTKRGTVQRPSPRVKDKATQACVPASLLVRAFDVLMARCAGSPSVDLSRVKAVGCCGVSHVPVFLAAKAEPLLASLSPSLPLWEQLSHPGFFSVPWFPTDRDYTGQSELADFFSSSPAPPPCIIGTTYAGRAAKGPASSVDLRLGTFPIHVAKLRSGEMYSHLRLLSYGERLPQTAWQSTRHITTVAGLLTSLLSGSLHELHPTEAAATGLMDVSSSQRGDLPSWDRSALKAVSGGATDELEEKLGKIYSDGSSSDPVGLISSWHVVRFGFNESCIVGPCMPAIVASYLSFRPDIDSIGLATAAQMDHLVVPMRSPRIPDGLQLPVQVLPSPVDAGTWLAVFTLHGAARARCIARDSSCSGRWRTFRHMLASVPFGSSPKMDDKCFAVVSQVAEQAALQRFEGGHEIPAFTDPRVEPLVVVEGQALSMRIAVGAIRSQDMGGSRSSSRSSHSSHSSHSSKYSVSDKSSNSESGHTSGAGGQLSFDPMTSSSAAERMFAWGKAAGDAGIAKVLSNVMGTGLWVDFADVKRADEAALPVLDAAAASSRVVAQASRSNPGARRAGQGAAFYASKFSEESRPDRGDMVLDSKDLVVLAEADRDMFVLYGALVEEYRRLASIVHGRE